MYGDLITAQSNGQVLAIFSTPYSDSLSSCSLLQAWEARSLWFLILAAEMLIVRSGSWSENLPGSQVNQPQTDSSSIVEKYEL